MVRATKTTAEHQADTSHTSKTQAQAKGAPPLQRLVGNQAMQQAKQAKAFLTNNSNTTIYWKGEEKTVAEPLEPHGICVEHVDGVATHKYKDRVFKLVDEATAVVEEDGDVDADWSAASVPMGDLVHAIYAGWKDKEWLADLQEAGDTKWDDLFAKAATVKPPPKASPPELHAVGTHAGAVVTYADTVSKPAPETLTFEQLRQKISALSASGESSAGFFTAVEFEATIPTSTPGLTIKVDVDGEYSQAGKGKELEVKLKVGVDFFGLSLKETQYLKLEGDDLGAAFEDAVKQIARQALIESGAEAALQKLATSEKARTAAEVALSPFAGPTAASLIRTAPFVYPRYVEFFKNNPNVGFEAGVGLELAVHIEEGDDLEFDLAGEAVAGLEDVGKTKATPFTEEAVSAELTVGTATFGILRSTRTRGDGTTREKIEVEAQMESVALDAPGLVQWIENFLRVGALAQAGTADVDAVQKTLASMARFSTGTNNIGFELSLERDSGRAGTKWKVEVRIKEFQSFSGEASGKKIGAEASLRYGIYFDVSAEIQTYLDNLQKPAQKQTPVIRRPFLD